MSAPTDAAPATAHSIKLSTRKKLLFALAPIVGVLLLAECGARIYRGVLWANYRELRLDMARRGYPAQLDPNLGYALIPGFSSSENFWGAQITVDADGIRTNGAAATSLTGRPLVAVGDSFTFGDEVSDADTWPAQLERAIGRRVKNGGVFGYGFDQTILRAENLLERYDPEWLLVSLIPNDLWRAELFRRYTEKPWFQLQGDQLILRNTPVRSLRPESLAPEEERLKHLIGYSALLDSIFARGELKWWYFAADRDGRAMPDGQGVEVGKRLVDRIAARCASRGCRLLIVMQERSHGFGSEDFLAHARSRGVPTLDLITEYRSLAAADATLHDRFFRSHMTPEGNGWVAERIAAEIRELEQGSRRLPR